MVSKVNTGLQMLYIGCQVIKPVLLMHFDGGASAIQLFLNSLQYLEWTVAGTTLWSGLSYAFSRNAIKVISKP
ncbi:unnamed protein product [Ambrosiozyma monospora]|uniref:Unnamed protein product n=1 Tax=Ambrosiozyma monospora TaxID=43982 RepID=A0ACB5SVD2_AMBMO|nr:unnamed protein product [Ambrosiozyma monospora]